MVPPSLVKSRAGGTTSAYSKLKCHKCHRSKPSDDFAPAEQGRGNLAMCKLCAPGQKNELKCAYCKVWKGVNSFNKTQRKEDYPRCDECCVKRDNGGSDDDVDHDSDDDSGHDDVADNDEEGTTTAGGPLGTTTESASGGVSLGTTNASDNGSVPNTNSGSVHNMWGLHKSAREDSSIVSGTGSHQASPGKGSTNTKGKNGKLPSSFQPNAYSRRSTASNAGTEKSKNTANGKWAKIKAYKPEDDDIVTKKMRAARITNSDDELDSITVEESDSDD